MQVLAIGVGSGVDDNELNAIASDPDSQNVYKAATFDSLTSLRGLLAAKACEREWLSYRPGSEHRGVSLSLSVYLSAARTGAQAHLYMET